MSESSDSDTTDSDSTDSDTSTSSSSSSSSDLDTLLEIYSKVKQQRYITDRSRNPRRSERMIDRLLYWEQRNPLRFRGLIRMKPAAFRDLVHKLLGTKPFQTQDRAPRTWDWAAERVAVALYRLRRSGDGAGVRDVALNCGCSEGSVVNWTRMTVDGLNELAEEDNELESALNGRDLPSLDQLAASSQADSLSKRLFRPVTPNGSGRQSYMEDEDAAEEEQLVAGRQQSESQSSSRSRTPLRPAAKRERTSPAKATEIRDALAAILVQSSQERNEARIKKEEEKTQRVLARGQLEKERLDREEVDRQECDLGDTVTYLCQL